MAVEFDVDNWKPDIHGPTWATDANGKFILPKLTLGYEALHWTFANLTGPDRGPWRYTPEQARLMLWLYAIDERGNFLFTDKVIQRLKGWGKDPTIATIAAFELLGPCRFSHFDSDGKVVGKQVAEPWIQIAAVSKTQTKNTMKLFPALIPAKTRKKYGMPSKLGRELVLALDGEAQIEAVTSSPATLEGGRPSLLVLNETHHWKKANDGIEMAQTGRDNANKVGGHVIAITNAFVPGENSVAEDDRKAYEDHRAGVAFNPSFMYDSLEAPANAPLREDVIAPILEVIRGDSYWFPIESTKTKILGSRTPRSRSRRMYFNQIVSSEDALVTSAEWDPLADETLKIESGDVISLGCDAGHSDDASALVAIRHRDRAIFLIKLWERPESLPDEERWQVDMDEVDGMVDWCFTNYNVRTFFSDVHPIESYVNKWSDKYRETVLVKASPGKSAIGFDMRGNGEVITRQNEALIGEIRDARVRHTGDLRLRRHVLNARERFNHWGLSFGKESRESKKKVDAYAATLLAFIAMNKYLESGKQPPAQKQRRGWLL